MPAETVNVIVEVPEGVSDSTREGAQHRAREAAVLALWEAAELTIRQAAAELDLDYYGFLNLLSERGIPVCRSELNTAAIDEAVRKLSGAR